MDVESRINEAKINLKFLGVTDVLVDGEKTKGAHVTTRPHNRKVVYHEPSGTWFIFHGTGNWLTPDGTEVTDKSMVVWHSSEDGKSFSEMSPVSFYTGHGSSVDVLLVGDRIYMAESRGNYWRLKAGIPYFVNGMKFSLPDRANTKGPNFYFPCEVLPLEVIDKHLVAGERVVALPGDRHIGTVGPHYCSITRDTNGYLWVTARASMGIMRTSPIGPYDRNATWVTRSNKPDDISSWKEHTVLFESQDIGTHAPQIIGLDEGRVACVLFTQYEKRTAVYLYNPSTEEWAEPHIIGKGYLSKRASAVFDPNSQRLHVVYMDEAGDARHRALSAPYEINDWSPAIGQPGNLVAEKAGANKGDDDLSLSVNLSKNPGTLALVHRGPDLHLHLKYYDGGKWSPKDVKTGTQNPELTCDEANAVADFSHGLGFIYWCRWRDPEVSKQKNLIGQVRFCLVKNVARLF